MSFSFLSYPESGLWIDQFLIVGLNGGENRGEQLAEHFADLQRNGALMNTLVD
jgi:hypothetical protein